MVELTAPADVTTMLTVETPDVLRLHIEPLVVALHEGPTSKLAVINVVANGIVDIQAPGVRRLVVKLRGGGHIHGDTLPHIQAGR